METVTRKTEIQTGFRERFEKEATHQGIAIKRTYSNAGITWGYEMTGPADAVRILGRRYSYGEWRNDFVK